MGLKKLITMLGFGKIKFDSIAWQQSPNSRKCYVKSIISDHIAIGMNEKQVVDLFGLDRKVYSRGVWSYHVPALTFGKGEKYMNFYFNDSGIVQNTKVVFRKRLKHKKNRLF